MPAVAASGTIGALLVWVCVSFVGRPFHDLSQTNLTDPFT